MTAKQAFASAFSRDAIFNSFDSNNNECASEDEPIFGAPAKTARVTPPARNESDTSPDSKKNRREKPKLSAKYECSYCDKKYKLHGALSRHIRSKHLNEEGNVRIETVKVGNKPVMPKTRENRTTKKKGKCHASSVSQELGRRIVLDNGKVVFECNVCQKRVTQNNLYRHARTHANNDDGPMIDLTQSSPSASGSATSSVTGSPNRKTSKLSRTLTNEYKCPTCHKTFEQRSNLKRHQTSMHGRVKRFTCRFCKKGLTSNQSLQKHERSHMKAHAKKLAAFEELNIQWWCKFCGKNDFANWDEMDDHRLAEHPVLTSQMRFQLDDTDDDEKDDMSEVNGHGNEQMDCDSSSSFAIDLVSVSDSQTSLSSQETLDVPTITSQFVSRVKDLVVCNTDDSDVYVFSDSE